jgi:hypothetical protein
MTDRYTLIEYMPEHLRSSHRAAGNSGRYPHNGAERVYVEGDIQASELHPNWASVVEDGVSLEYIPEQDRGDLLPYVPDEALAPVRDLDDELACAGDYAHDRDRDDRLTGDID